MARFGHPYPINEGVSGYWDYLSPEDLNAFDVAMDYVQIYIEATRENRQQTVGEAYREVAGMFADQYKRGIEDNMPSIVAFGEDPGNQKDESLKGRVGFKEEIDHDGNLWVHSPSGLSEVQHPLSEIQDHYASKKE